MKICLVHNEYGKLSGEEVVVQNQRQMLQSHGHEVIPFFRRSADISDIRFGQIRSFFSGIYSFKARADMRRMLARQKPDIVHVHNVFPLISPSVLAECGRQSIATVMTVHNYRLICPTGLLFQHGRVCTRCKKGHEYWCVLQNCEENIGKSIGYALRNWFARSFSFYLNNVRLFLVLTQFQKRLLVEEGFPSDRIIVIPNMVNGVISDSCRPNGYAREHVSFVGRINASKGVSTLLSAAGAQPDIPLYLAGSVDAHSTLVSEAPSNARFLGAINHDSISTLLSKSRFLVFTSVWYEGMPMAILEAMQHGIPVICSRIGGLPEIVEDGVTGLLVEPGNAGDLAQAMRKLWDDPALCRRLGDAGRQKVLREYSPEVYYERTMEAYHRALSI